MTTGVYKILNSINNKVYIGCSLNIEERLKSHKALLALGKHGNDSLQDDVFDYAFDFTVGNLHENPELFAEL